MRLKCTWFVLLFISLAWGTGCFADQLQKEFSFRLEPGEASRTWDCVVNFSGNSPNCFIGREFKTTTSASDVELRVIRESLISAMYQVKAGLFRIGTDSANAAVTGSLEVSLSTGMPVPSIPPKRPRMVGWEGLLVWEGDGDAGKTLPVSGRYLSYQICSGDDNQILDEQVIPVYARGFRIPLHHWKFETEKKYILYVRLSDHTGQYSQPHIAKLFFRKKPANLGMGK